MSSSSEICIDANLVIRGIGPRRAPAVAELWRGWARDRVTLHAPTLLRYEVINGTHRLRSAGLLSTEDAGRALTRAFRLPIVFHSDDALHLRAFQLATDHGLAAAYDAHYLAVAERLGVDLWTTDGKLVKAVGERLPWVRLAA